MMWRFTHGAQCADCTWRAARARRPFCGHGRYEAWPMRRSRGINRCRPGDWGSLRWWPQNGWSIMENPWTSYYIKCMYDLGVPPRILGNHHMVSCNVRCYSKQTILWEQPWQNLEHAPCTASPAHICISYLNILCICGVCLCGAGTCWDTAACRGKTLNPLLPTWRMIHLQLLVPFWTEHSWN